MLKFKMGRMPQKFAVIPQNRLDQAQLILTILSSMTARINLKCALRVLMSQACNLKMISGGRILFFGFRLPALLKEETQVRKCSRSEKRAL